MPTNKLPGKLIEAGKAVVGAPFMVALPAAILGSVFFFFAEDETVWKTMAWLAWVLLPTISVPIALLIMSLWRPARLFTGGLMCLFAALSFSVLIFNCGAMLRLLYGRFLPLPFGIGTFGIGWLLLMLLGTIFKQEWRLLLVLLTWMGVDILAGVVGALIAHSGYGWLKELENRWL